METVELVVRLGLAIGIGAIVGVERHWRERDEKPGQRTAGLRTFTLCGMFGGLSGAIELFLNTSGIHSGLVIVGFFSVFSLIFALFKIREAVAFHHYSVTSTIVAMTTFALGVVAVIGDDTFAAAGGVTLVCVLASRHILHAFMRALKWEELRSAIIFLAMVCVVWPLIPAQRLNYLGGLSLSDIWTLVVLLAGISFAGYLALRLMGERLGQILAGGLGGLISSTAVTLTNARLSRRFSPCDDLVAGALAANSVSLLKTLMLSLLLSNSVAIRLAPALLVAATILGAGAWLKLRTTVEKPALQLPRSPFEMFEVFKLAFLITVVAVAGRMASEWFGHTGLLSVAALSGLADTDAVIVSIAALRQEIDPDLAARAIGSAVISNTVGKCCCVAVLGSRKFIWHFSLFSIIALTGGISIFYIVPTGN